MAEAISLLSLTGRELLEAAQSRLESGAGLAKQIYKQADCEGKFAPESWGLNEASVAAWRRHFSFQLPEVAQVVTEPSTHDIDQRETIKVVLRTHDNLEIECVRIPMAKERYSLCISSQVGCRLACRFCETGKLGLLRNLSVEEIVGQLIVAKNILGWPIQNIVFMGMGEPLDNADNVIQALRVFNDDLGLGMGQQRLRICTAGKPDGIRKLAEMGWPRLQLSISLNAAVDHKRDRLMPINKQHNLAEIQAALLSFFHRKKYVLAVNYCLMPDFNDSYQDILAVKAFCEPLGRVLLNVIPYNPGSKPLTRAPEDQEVDAFIEGLKAEGLAVSRRKTKGRSVMAACGQLGNLELRQVRRGLAVLPPLSS